MFLKNAGYDFGSLYDFGAYTELPSSMDTDTCANLGRS